MYWIMIMVLLFTFSGVKNIFNYKSSQDGDINSIKFLSIK